MSATKTGRWNGGVGQAVPADDAHEEVGREERAEEHDLRPDEEEHAEDARRDPRAVVRLGRVLVHAVVELLRVRGHQAPTPAGTSTSTCLIGSFVSVAEPLEQVAAHPAGARVRERRDDQLVDALVLDRLHDRRERIGMRDLAVRLDALAAQQRHGAQQPLLRLLVAALRVALRRDDQEARTGSARRARGSRRAAASRAPSRSRRRARSWTPARRRTSTTRCWNGRSPATRRICSTALRRSQPDFCCGCVETITSLGLQLVDRVAERGDRVGLDDDAVRVHAGAPEQRRASCRAAAAPRRAACRSRRRSPGAAGSPARSPSRRRSTPCAFSSISSTSAFETTVSFATTRICRGLSISLM